MKRYRTLLTVCAVIFVLAGIVQTTLALTYHRAVGRVETDRFVHDFYPAGEGIPYEQLFDHATRLQQQLSGLTVAFHALTGVAAIVIGLLLYTFAHDAYIDLSGRRRAE